MRGRKDRRRNVSKPRQGRQFRALRVESLETRILLANAIVAENLLPGNPPSEWDIDGAGDENIQGYATDISVDQGETVFFKVQTDAIDYRLDIYRIGYYAGLGARKVATVQPTLVPFAQPDPLTDDDTGLVDAGNWSVTASWNVPETAVSGVYVAKLVRESGPAGESHIIFIVRDDDGESDILLQTADTTWQAYNTWGGNSLYIGGPGVDPARAYAVSYNRPFSTRSVTAKDWFFSAEYPMVRFLEANGYDVSYFTGVDSDRYGSEILEHEMFVSVGHDEYWSGPQREYVEAARDAGVDMAFFSGNEVYWRTRWETSIDDSGTPYRTMVSYKETFNDQKIDPSEEWTGTWRDPRFTTPGDGVIPENALTGTAFTVNRGPGGDFGTSIQVPADDGKMRLWRYTTIAALQPGEVATLANGTLGYEWDEDLDNGYRPAGLIRLSTTTESVPQHLNSGYGGLNDFGPGDATHNLTMYRAPSGALVFGAGTVQWAFGLDGVHDGTPTVADSRMQQATINLFADMGVQPATRMAHLVAATASTDVAPPTSVITSLASGLVLQSGGTPIVISGIATDADGVVGGVEISTDGGATWRRAEGRGSWSYSWVPNTPGAIAIKTRAADDSANLEVPGAGITVTVVSDESTAPAISAVNALVVNNQTAIITWSTDETSDSRVIYGTSPGSLTQSAYSASMVTAHSVTLTNLVPNTNYYYRAVSEDEFGNEATSPLPPAGPAQVSTPAFTDTTLADFSAGTFDAGATIVAGGDGEVILTPSLDAEFQSAGLPSGWTATPWAMGGSVSVTGGSAIVDGALLAHDSAIAGGRSLEFMATFSGAPHQHAGFGVNLNGNPWAIFSSFGGNGLYARTNTGTLQMDTVIPGNWLGGSHRFRIDWNAGSVVYFIDNVEVARHNMAISSVMRPIVSDATPDAGGLTVDWIRLSTYAAQGQYESRVFDAGSPVVWTRIAWIAETMAGTGAAISVRMGDTPTPDSNWTDYIPIGASGATIGGQSRYLQYRVELSTANSQRTSVLHNVALSYSTAGVDAVPPAVVGFAPVAGAAGVSPGASVTVAFSELMNAASIHAGTLRLRRIGASTDVPATVSYRGSTATLTPLVPLAPEASYAVTVSGTITDRSGNPIGGDLVWSFTTGWLSFNDSSGIDFVAGQVSGGTAVLETGDGEVSLSPTEVEEFFGSVLPADWFNQPWSGGSATVSAGRLNVDGALTGTNAFFGPGQTLEFVATFTGDSYQHIGFGVDFADFPWAIFSTGSGGTLRARTSLGGDTFLPAIPLGVPHLFRIAWTSSSITFFVDGAQVAQHNVSQTGNMRPLVSDHGVGGGQLQVDWLRLLPYAPQGSFTSRVFDAGEVVAWDRGFWNSDVPANTTLQVAARVGNSPDPDATWSEFLPIAASGDLLGVASRYVQYRAELTSNSALVTPLLEDISLRYSAAVADSTPPQLTSQSPPPNSPEVGLASVIEATFSDLIDPATVNSGTFRLRAQGVETDVSATLTVSGSRITLQPNIPLDPKTTYAVTLAGSISDLSGNPIGIGAQWNFTTTWLKVMDVAATNFGQGTTAGTQVAASGGIALAPQFNEPFSGTMIPAGWSNASWNGGGGTTVGGGVAAVNGALFSAANLFQPGSTVQFTAQFSGAPYQHMGWGTDLSGPPWAIFSTREGNNLYARTSGVGDTLIPGNWFEGPHQYRIEWAATIVRYFIDGQLVATHNATLTAGMRPLISDYDSGAGNVQVDSVHVTPYVPSGSFHSRVFDAGSTVTWEAAEWSGSTPAGASLEIAVRTGQTPTPDGTWTAFVPLAASGTVVGAQSRYLQYRATLATSAPNATPTLDAISIRYSEDADAVPPFVVAQSPAPSASNVNLAATIQVVFNELLDPTSIHSSSLRVRRVGAASDEPATLAYDGGSLTLTPAVALAGNAQYTVTLSGTISDLSGNLLGSDFQWTFATGVGTWTQSTTSDFASGTNSGTMVGSTGDGAIQIAPTFGDEFGGTTLSSDWSAQSWASQGGGPTSINVAGGILSVGGAQVLSTTTFSGVPFATRIELGATVHQHFGLATDLSSFEGNYWAIFSTGGTSDTLYARVNLSGATEEVNLGSRPVGFHDYRIVPTGGGFQFYVDGQLRTTINAAFPGGTPLRAALSSYLGSPSQLLRVESVHMESYPAVGEFVSGVFDASRLATWSTASWSASLPAGTALIVETRSGDSAAPDLAWSGWTAVANGAAVASPAGRYLQYRVRLTTIDTSVTPVLTSITFYWE